MNKQPFAFKDQQCNVLALALGWLGYFGGIIYFVYQRSWIVGALFVVLIPCVRWVLFHFFPTLSRFLGYGRVDDQFPESTNTSRVVVTFYSFFSCPFCPIVLRSGGGSGRQAACRQPHHSAAGRIHLSSSGVNDRGLTRCDAESSPSPSRRAGLVAGRTCRPAESVAPDRQRDRNGKVRSQFAARFSDLASLQSADRIHL
jgi:hypothetical protein